MCGQTYLSCGWPLPLNEGTNSLRLGQPLLYSYRCGRSPLGCVIAAGYCRIPQSFRELPDMPQYLTGRPFLCGRTGFVAWKSSRYLILSDILSECLQPSPPPNTEASLDYYSGDTEFRFFVIFGGPIIDNSAGIISNP